MNVVRIALAVVLFASIVLTFAEIVNLRFFFRKNRAAAGLKRCPIVSIIKPLKGSEPFLRENLESFRQIDYPCYELILAFASPDDPAVPLVRQFLDTWGDPRVRLLIDPSTLGHNPKISNLNNGVKAATGEILVFSDSDSRATPDFLHRLVRPLEDERVGIVSGIAFFRGGQGFWPRAKAVTYNSTVTLYNALWCRFIPVTAGGAVALRRAVFDEIGGFAPIADKLTDDQEMGMLVHAHGYRVELIPYPVSLYEESIGFRGTMQQILRWLVAIKAAAPYDYNLIVFANMAFLAALYWLSAPASLSHIAVLAAVLLFRVAMPFYIHRTYLKDAELARDAWMILPTDFVLTALWLVGQWHRRLTWRGQEFVIRKGQLVPVEKGGHGHS